MGLATSMENAKILRAFGKARRKYNAEPVNSRKNVVIFFATVLSSFIAVSHLRTWAHARARDAPRFQFEFICYSSHFFVPNSRITIY